MKKKLTAMTFAIVIIICLAAGCASSRTLRLDVPLGEAAAQTPATVTARVSEKAATAWNVGDLALSARATRTADGATSATATATSSKSSMSGMWSAALGAAAGILAAIGAAGL